MQVILSAGPLGGESVEWPDSAVDGDVRDFETANEVLAYRLDFEFGQATLVSVKAKPSVVNPFIARAEEARKASLRIERDAALRALGATFPEGDLATIPDAEWVNVLAKAQAEFDAREAKAVL